jgi:hypothetical protein
MRCHFVVIKIKNMKKLVLSFLFIGALAVAGSAQTTQKTTKSTQPVTKSKMVTKTNSSSSTAQVKKPSATTSTTQKTVMTKPKHKHHPLHKTKQKTITK